MAKPHKTMVAIPSTRDGVKVATLRMICDAMLDGIMEGVYFDIPQLEAVVPISSARNLALAVFMASDCDDIFFVDDDLCTERGAMMRLIKQPVEFVGGVYPHRVPTEGYPVQWRKWGEPLDPDPETGLLEVHGLPGGFMRLKRSVVEKLTAAHPDLWYHCEQAPKKRAPALFDFELRGHMMYAEDFTFCKRWRDIGGKVWMDPDITFVHIGPVAVLGNIGKWLRRTSAEAAD